MLRFTPFTSDRFQLVNDLISNVTSAPLLHGVLNMIVQLTNFHRQLDLTISVRELIEGVHYITNKDTLDLSDELTAWLDLYHDYKVGVIRKQSYGTKISGEH